MFRFTIRDVLWLTALVAMGAAWFHQSTIRESEKRTLIDQHETALANERWIRGEQVSCWTIFDVD